MLKDGGVMIEGLSTDGSSMSHAEVLGGSGLSNHRRESPSKKVAFELQFLFLSA